MTDALLRRIDEVTDEREALRRRLDMSLEREVALTREVEQLRQEVARLRLRDADLTFAGARLGGGPDAA